MEFDKIGYWSELKLEIIRKYAQAYSTILSKQRLKHMYVDGFSGAGEHISRATGEVIPGSPLNALHLDPPFSEYFLIDLDGEKVDHLRCLVGKDSHVHVLEGDCNRRLLEDVFPNIRYQDYRRGLCLLDPYGLHLDWEVIATAGEMKSLEIFLNFPIMDMNRNVLWRSNEGPTPDHTERMTRFWGDESWKGVAYREERQLSLFGELRLEKQSNEVIAEAFRIRLQEVAGFGFVPQPVPMRNTKGAVVYYLFFASQNATGDKIVNEIFSNYRDRRS